MDIFYNSEDVEKIRESYIIGAYRDFLPRLKKMEVLNNPESELFRMYVQFLDQVDKLLDISYDFSLTAEEKSAQIQKQLDYIDEQSSKIREHLK